MKRYLWIMLIFQILIIVVAILPLGLEASEKLRFIVVTDCGLLGAAIGALRSIRNIR